MTQIEFWPTAGAERSKRIAEQVRTKEPCMTTLPDDIDAEVVTLCEAMNRLPGIDTTESCCGHGREPFRIFFVAASLEALPPVVEAVDSCHSGVRGWDVIATTHCAMSPVQFLLEGPKGDYRGADRLAAVMTELSAELRALTKGGEEIST